MLGSKKGETILVLGANGQVGTEVCLYLNKRANVDVIAVTRTEVATALLTRLGIKCISGEISTNKELQHAVNNADLVFDLAAPAMGTVNQIRNIYKKRLVHVFSYMSKGSIFVFASSRNAFGYYSLSPSLRNHFIPGTIYATTKRYAEKLSAQLGRHYDIDVYLFRLGEVHGVMQKSTFVLRKLINDGYSFSIPDTPAATVFTYEISEALILALKKIELPGLYTLVSTIEWTWEELLLHIASKDKKKPKISVTHTNSDNVIRQYIAMLRSGIYRFLNDRRDIMRANITVFSRYLPAIKHIILVNRAKKEITRINNTPEYVELKTLVGVLPGKRMRSLPCIKKTISKLEQDIENDLEKLLI